MTDRPEAPKGTKGRQNGKDPARVAVISVHTSPRDQPGSGDSGGMNVYVLSVARRLAEQGIAVDIYTRCHGQGGPDVDEITPGTRLVNVQAGPCAPVAKDDLPRLLPKGDRPEPPARLAGEKRVIAGADRILAPTPLEADHLVNLYGADRDRIRVVPPGVDGTLFAPRPKDEARARLHLANARLLLFVGRLQPFKGPEVAIRALAEAVARAPQVAGDVVLAVVGGSTGRDAQHDQATRLMELAADIGVSDRVVFFPPQPHERLADFYSAAEVVLVPSRSESFGLAALEAEACGTPVIAAATGGLRYVVIDGQTGFLVEGHDPSDYADRILRILSDPVLATRLSKGALRHAGRFSWDATAADIRGVYRELLARRGA